MREDRFDHVPPEGAGWGAIEAESTADQAARPAGRSPAQRRLVPAASRAVRTSVRRRSIRGTRYVPGPLARRRRAPFTRSSSVADSETQRRSGGGRDDPHGRCRRVEEERQLERRRRRGRRSPRRRRRRCRRAPSRAACDRPTRPRGRPARRAAEGRRDPAPVAEDAYRTDAASVSGTVTRACPAAVTVRRHRFGVEPDTPEHLVSVTGRRPSPCDRRSRRPRSARRSRRRAGPRLRTPRCGARTPPAALLEHPDRRPERVHDRDRHVRVRAERERDRGRVGLPVAVRRDRRRRSLGARQTQRRRLAGEAPSAGVAPGDSIRQRAPAGIGSVGSHVQSTAGPSPRRDRAPHRRRR